MSLLSSSPSRTGLVLAAALVGSVALAQAPAPTPPAPAAADAPKPAAPKAPKETPELVAKGKATFTTTCMVCHGDKGDGNGPAGAAMNPKPRDFTKDAFKNGYKVEDVFMSITNGVKDTAMVGFGTLPEEDRWGLAYYVLSMVPAELKSPPKGKGKKGATPAPAAAPAPATK